MSASWARQATIHAFGMAANKDEERTKDQMQGEQMAALNMANFERLVRTPVMQNFGSIQETHEVSEMILGRIHAFEELWRLPLTNALS